MMRWNRVIGSVVAALAAAAVAQPTESVSYVEMDGVDDEVVSYADFSSGEVTAEAWVRIDDSHPEFASGIVTWGTQTQGSWSFSIRNPSDRRLTFFINYNNGTQRTLRGTTALPQGEWHHVAATYDGTTAKLYIDAVLDAEGVLGDPINQPNDPGQLTIGNEVANLSEYIKGGFDDVMVWSEARTADEIADDMMGGGKSGGSALMAWYTFDEFGSNIVVDASGNGRHAHLGNDYDIGNDDPTSTRWDDGMSRRRYLTLTSSRNGDVQFIGGGLADQIALVNSGSTNDIFWSPIINRNNDFHMRAEFVCTAEQDLPFVDSETFLTGANEVTRHNCESAFYRFAFYMPPMYDNAEIYGVANADDMGVVFMNHNAITPVIEQDDLDNFGDDRLDPAGRPVLGWPTADPLFAFDSQDMFVPGKNELLVAVASDISEFEPAGTEFIVVVAYDCLADWNADGVHNTLDFSEFLNAWASQDPEADVNMDGRVNTIDFVNWLNIWSFGCPD